MPATGWKVEDYINRRDAEIHGLEYQLRWKPRQGTELWLNQTSQRYRWDDGWQNHLPPSRATTVALFQKLPANIDLSVIFHTTSPMTWRGDEDELPRTRRLDLRLAYPFRIGSTRAEAAVTVQAANKDLIEFQPTQGFIFKRRAYGTLRLEF